jgi:hypothetical protein
VRWTPEAHFLRAPRVSDVHFTGQAVSAASKGNGIVSKAGDTRAALPQAVPPVHNHIPRELVRSAARLGTRRWLTARGTCRATLWELAYPVGQIHVALLLVPPAARWFLGRYAICCPREATRRPAQTPHHVILPLFPVRSSQVRVVGDYLVLPLFLLLLWCLVFGVWCLVFGVWCFFVSGEFHHGIRACIQ